MPKLINTNGISTDPWVLIDKDVTLESALENKTECLLLPAGLWANHASEIQSSNKQIGLWLDSNETPDLIEQYLPQLSLIALNFPAFTDGRSYTSATSLRQRYKYEGELRAIGDVLRDQLFAMKRCGFDSFSVSDETNDEALNAFKDFSDSYQSSIEEPQPLFRRRQG